MVLKNKTNIALVLLLVVVLAGFCIKGYTVTSGRVKSGNFEGQKIKAGFSLFSFKKKPSAISPVDYVSWIEHVDNGLKVEKEVGDFLFSLQYKPYEYIAIKEAKRTSITKDELEKSVDEISDLQYYTFQIAKTDMAKDPLTANVDNNNDFQKRIDYFSFHIQDDIKLVENGDTLDCVLCHFERTFNLSPYNSFSLAFNATGQPKGDRTFLYADKLFGTGPVKMIITKNDIEKIPQPITN